jgi:hypothetical protein
MAGTADPRQCRKSHTTTASQRGRSLAAQQSADRHIRIRPAPTRNDRRVVVKAALEGVAAEVLRRSNGVHTAA